MSTFTEYTRKLDEAIRPNNYGSGGQKSGFDKIKDYLFGDQGDNEEQYVKKSDNLYRILADYLGLGVSQNVRNYIIRGPLAGQGSLQPFEQALLKVVHSAIGDAQRGGVRPQVTREDASRLMQAMNMANARFDDKTPEGLVEFLNRIIAREGETLTISPAFKKEIEIHNDENQKDIRSKRQMDREQQIAKAKSLTGGPQFAGDTLRNNLSNATRLHLIQSIIGAAKTLENQGNIQDAEVLRLFAKGLS